MEDRSGVGSLWKIGSSKSPFAQDGGRQNYGPFLSP